MEQGRESGEVLTLCAIRRALTQELKLHLGIGFAESRGGRMYNSFAVFGPAGDLAQVSRGIDPLGTIVAQDDGGGDQIVMARITLDSRIGKGAIHSRKPELYRELVR